MRSFELESLLKVSETSSRRVPGRKKERLTVCSGGCLHCLGWDHQSAATPTGAKSMDYTGTAQPGQHPCTHPPIQVPVPQTPAVAQPTLPLGRDHTLLAATALHPHKTARPQNSPRGSPFHGGQSRMTCCLTPQTAGSYTPSSF